MVTGLEQKRRKKINRFVIIVLLLILIPEVIGHTLFDKSHPASSSVNAAISLTNKLDNGYSAHNFGCQLVIQNDSSQTNITRASGLEGRYGEYHCGTGG